MAHEITRDDGIFTVREPAWHGLGHVFPDHPTREEAQKIAHPWEPISEPVYLAELGFGLEEDTDSNNLVPRQEFDQIEGYQAIRRSDNGNVLGVVRDTYEPVTNNELWDIAEALEQSGSDVQYETGGSLLGGSKVWLLLKLKEPLEIKGDKHGQILPYYALQNSHNGTGAFRGQALMTRIVCSNTAQIADMEARTKGTEFTFNHTKNIGERIEEARMALSGWRHSIEEWKLLTEHLIQVTVTEDQQLEFIDRFFPIPEADIVSERVIRNIENAQDEFIGILNGVTCEDVAYTAYGLVQASVEYAEHYRRAHTHSSRFRRTYLDRNQLVANATQLVREIAYV